MKINLRSQYDQFTAGRKPQYFEWSREPQRITCYINEYARTVDTPAETSIAIIIEPRSILPEIYPWIENNAHRFKYIFTHDDTLLKALPNTKVLLFGGVWDSAPEEKTKNVSMISSNKRMCPLHIDRTNLAIQLEGKIDTYGTYKGNFVSTRDAHGPYRFAVVVENYRNDFWFTEKICNCFACKTIPVYYGAKKISDYFNPAGIIEVDHLEDIPLIVDILNEAEYNKRLAAVEDNYERVKKYYCFEDWFYMTYKDLLEAI